MASLVSTISKRTNLRILQKIAMENRVPFLDMEEKLDPIAKDLYLKKGILLWETCDTHMNALGARYTSEIIKKFIEDNLSSRVPAH